MRELSVAFETSSTMRVLILSALLACASAAPSHLVPVALAALPIAVPTVPAGDLQAASINAQVRILDQAQVAVDQARELAEKATYQYNEGVLEGKDLSQEKTEEAFWANEEKKWQALNEAQIAAAKLDASVASSVQVVPYAADESIVSVAPGIAAPAAVGESEKADVKSAVDSEVKSAVDSEVKSEAVSEVKSEDKENVEVTPADYKSTEIKSESEKSPEEHLDTLIQGVKKFGIALQALKTTYPAPVAVAPSVFHSPVVYPAYRGYPISAVQYPGQLYAPTGPLFIKNSW